MCVRSWHLEACSHPDCRPDVCIFFFVIQSAARLARPLPISCGCFGTARKRTSRTGNSILRDRTRIRGRHQRFCIPKMERAVWFLFPVLASECALRISRLLAWHVGWLGRCLRLVWSDRMRDRGFGRGLLGWPAVPPTRAVGWMRCAEQRGGRYRTAHYFALGWVITAAILRLLSRSYMCIAMPIAWTIGTAAAVVLLVTCFGRVGYFYIDRIAQTQVSVPVVQVADLAGMAGVEFLIAAAAGSCCDRHVRPLMACALVLIGVCLYAQIRMDNMATAGTIRTALLQKCVPPTEDIRATLCFSRRKSSQEWSDAKWSRFADRLGGIAVVGVSRTDGPREYNSVLLATRDCVRSSTSDSLSRAAKRPRQWIGRRARNSPAQTIVRGRTRSGVL